MAYGALSSTQSPQSFVAVTPSDTVAVTGVQWLRIGAAGNLALQGIATGSTPVTMAVTAGEYVPFGNGLVMATGTTATGIIAFS